MAKQKHSKHRFHLTRVGLFAVLLLAFFVVRIDAHANPATQNSSNGSVLAYATEMSRSGLFAATNAARAANGLGPLALDSRLNNSAQMKAEDMAAKDYWAHVAPDGTQPWYFFEQAGYSYIRAGENLAYGFSSSQATVDGWMNSPSHRENVLGDYVDVGFGFVNVPDYQSSGNQTIVVAHYGTPQPAPTAPVAATAAPAPTAPAAPTAPSTETTPAKPDVAEPAKPQTPEQPAQKEAAPVKQIAAATPVKTAAPERVSVLSLLMNHNLPLAAMLSLALLSTALVGYALTHRLAFQHAVANGEHFVVAHPGLDTAAIGAITSLILLTTYGNIG
jgi:uncharacterized protein YkwD